MGQAGPLGGEFPVVTREGHNILDVIFTSPIENLGKFCKCYIIPVSSDKP